MQVEVKVFEKFGRYPFCYDKKCECKEECANHISADYERLEHGKSPSFLGEDGNGWDCHKKVSNNWGALMCDGTYLNRGLKL